MHPQIWIFRAFAPRFCCCCRERRKKLNTYFHWSDNNRCQSELFPPNWFSLFAPTARRCAQRVNCSSYYVFFALWDERRYCWEIDDVNDLNWLKVFQKLRTKVDSIRDERLPFFFAVRCSDWDGTQIIIIRELWNTSLRGNLCSRSD